MVYQLLATLVCIGWSNGTAHAHTGQAESTTQSSPAESTIKEVVEGIIKNQLIDIGITDLTMKQDSTSRFQMKGSADRNSSIAVLIKALEDEPTTSKVYLVSTQKSAVDGKPRQVFVMDAAYAVR